MEKIGKFEFHQKQEDAFKNAEEEGEDFYFAIDKNENGSKMYGNPMKFGEFIKIYTNIIKNDNNDNIAMYEVIKKGNKRMEYYDIDKQTDKKPSEIFEEFEEIYSNFLIHKGLKTTPAWTISDSSKKGKASIHLINNKRGFKNEIAMREWYDEFKYFCDTHYTDKTNIFDKSVCSANRCMRMIYSTKYNQNRPLKYAEWYYGKMGPDIKDFFIQNITCEDYNIINEREKIKEDHKELEYDCGEIKKINSDDEIDILTGLIVECIQTGNHPLCDIEFKKQMDYANFRNLMFSIINASIEKGNEYMPLFKKYDLYKLYRHHNNYNKKTVLGTIISNCEGKKEGNKYGIKSLHYWGKYNGNYIKYFKKIEKSDYTAEDEAEASEILLKAIGNDLIFCDNQYWIRCECERIYKNNLEDVKAEMINRCMNLNIRNKKGASYSGKYSATEKIVKTALNKVRTNMKYRNDEFTAEMVRYTKNKIFFKNGYIQMPEMECVNDELMDGIITPVRIQRDIPDFKKINKVKIEELMKNILIPILGSKQNADNYLEHISRAITGHIEDKHFCLLDGLRNSGKGVLTDLNRYTFTIYSGITSANNFLMEKSHTHEDPKKYSWLSQLRWVRLLHTSEVKFDVDDKNLKIDGNLIKGKLASGGDIIEVRDLYQTTIRIQPQSKLIIMCNDIPPISPPDAIQEMARFRMPNKFINKKEYESKNNNQTLLRCELEADENIKNKVQDIDLCTTYLYVVLKAFKNHPVVNCKNVKKANKDIKIDLGDDTAFIKENFKFGNNKDYILASDLKGYITSQGMKISITKLKTLLLFNGAIETKNLPPADGLNERGNKRGYIGVSFICEPENI